MATITTMTGAQFRCDALRRGPPVGVDQWRTDFGVHSYVAASGYRVQDTACPSALSGKKQDCGSGLGEKALRLDPDKTPIPGVPDIAIEVISPTECASESHDKVRAYLRNGSAEVWQVYPKSRTVQIYRGEISRSVESSQQVESDLLPGFVLPLSSLFE